MAEILVVDDDKAILEMIKRVLEKDGHRITALDGAEQVDFKTITAYDLIVLDIMMPGMDGYELCEKIRQQVDCPILFLTAKTGEDSLVKGLSLGADDYISKPFGIMELRARIRAHLRREHREHSVRLTFERCYFNLSLKQMYVDGQKIALTKGEYDICEFLAQNKGQTFTKEQILERVFGFESESDESTITTHIKNIRMKLKSCGYMPIRTVWGIGYTWEA